MFLFESLKWRSLTLFDIHAFKRSNSKTLFSAVSSIWAFWPSVQIVASFTAIFQSDHIGKDVALPDLNIQAKATSVGATSGEES